MNSPLNNFQIDICDQYPEKFRAIYKESYLEFASVIDFFSEENKENLFWWISATASRSELQSNLYRDFCSIKLVSLLAKENILPSRILVRSDAIKTVLQQTPQLNKIVIYANSKKYKVIERIRMIFQSLHFFFNKILQKQLIAIYFNESGNLKNKVIIENFVSSDSIKDRYYPDLKRFLDNPDKEIIYLPTIINTNIFTAFNLIKRLKSSGSTYLFKETHSSYQEILQASFYRNYFQAFNFPLLNIELASSSFNLLPLFQEALSAEKFSSLSAEGVLNYSLVKNLSKLHFRIDTVIDWWENTAMDKGLNLGFHHFYSHSPVKGYMGFVPNKFSFELAPSVIERNSGVIPETIGVMGNIFLNTPRRIAHEQKTVVAPALRFNHLFHDRPEKSNVNNTTVLVVLPAFIDQANNILETLLKSHSQLKEFYFIIKIHPACKINRKYFQSLFSNATFDDQRPINELIQDASLMITGASSASIEAIMLNMPVLNICSTQLPFTELIPGNLRTNLFHEYRQQENLLIQIQKLISLYENKIASSLNINDYFCKPTSNNVTLFFNSTR